jgi:hypothetical protein
MNEGRPPPGRPLIPDKTSGRAVSRATLMTGIFHYDVTRHERIELVYQRR